MSIFNANSIFQVVAIMGAHSLGGASGASGWEGTFTGNDSSKSIHHFDENYYVQMVDEKFNWTNIEHVSCH